MYSDHIAAKGVALFERVCAMDLEGVVAKYAQGAYVNGNRTSWIKVRNPRYSQAEGRVELFEGYRS